MEGEFFIRSVALPGNIRAVTLPNDDGTFDIYVNRHLPEELQQRALEHELSHIRLGHFYDDAPVRTNEQEAG